MKRFAAALFFCWALPLMGGEPSPLEDVNVFAESGRNRSGAALLSTSFFLSGGREYGHELAHEWSSARHQFGVTLPLFGSSRPMPGDATVNYRYQLIGDEDSRIAVAPRLSLVLPTRSARIGDAATGVQLNVPVSTRLAAGLELHSNAGATLFQGDRPSELNLAQSLVAETSRFSFSLEAAYTRCRDGGELFVLRPGLQVAIDGPGGLRIVPGISLPLQGDGVLFHVGLERSLSR